MAAVSMDIADIGDIGETPEPELAPPTPTPTSPSSSIRQTVLATLVVTVIAAAMGALFAIPPPAPPAPPPKIDATAGGVVPAGAGLFDMPPIVTNLGAPQDTWIRLEASIVYDAAALPRPESMAAEIAGDELAYMRTVTLAQLAGPVGLQNIRQDLNERAVIRSGGKVTELILRTLVVQ
jgi:flagellar FliL protein